MADAPFTPDEFRELFAEIPASVRAPLRRACNTALLGDLTREDIEAAYGTLPDDHPEVIAAATGLAARITEIRGS